MCPTPADARPERIPIVDLHTVRELLRMKSALEPAAQSTEDADAYWFELLRGHSEADVFDAVWAHYRTVPRTLWPTDILDRVDSLAAARSEAVRTVRAEILRNLPPGRHSDDWTTAFDEEIARGASVDEAMRAADACARTSTRRIHQMPAKFANLC